MSTPEFHPPEEPRQPAPHRRADEGLRRAPPGGPAGTSGPRRTSRAVMPQVGSPVRPDDPLRFPLDERELAACVRAALVEEGALEDVATAAAVLSSRRAHGTILAREAGVVAGVPLAITAFRLLDSNVAIRVDADDGTPVAAGAMLMRITGLAHGILAAEGVALNFLRRLSGVATITSRFVDAVRGTSAHIADTRMTTPGLAALEHYAARAGGALDGSDAVGGTTRVRRNHLVSVNGDVAMVVRRVRELAGSDARIEVECRSAGQVRDAVAAGADVVLLAAMNPAQARECVEAAGGLAVTAVTGPMRLDAVRAFAQAGVDRIAVEAITQNAPALAMSLEFEPA